jgi:hypothetical protein
MAEENTQTLETSGLQNNETDINVDVDNKTYTEDDVQNLLKALKSEREARKIYEKEVKEKAAQLEKFATINPDEYRKLQEEASIAAREKAAADERTSLLEEKYGSQAAEAVKKAEAANRELLEFRKRYALEKEFYAAGGRTDSADGVSFFDMFVNQIGQSFRLETNGTVTVVDGAGDPVLDSDSGKRVSPVDYLANFKSHPVYGTFFKGNKGSGAGIGFSGTDANGVIDDWNELSTEEKFLRAFG